ncbi:MAG: hypothetical protein RIM99_02090 [Cyclobacteriaceae bacterium]
MNYELDMKKSVFIFLLILGTLSGCNDELAVVYSPQDTLDYEVFKEIPENDTVLLVLSNELTHDINPEKELALKLSYFPYNIMLVHQAQTKDPSLSNQYYMTNVEADQINTISAEILKRTIEHFKSEGKYVIVFGDFIGSFLALKSIQLFGLKADTYALLNGRLDVEQEIVEVAEGLRLAVLNENREVIVGNYIINHENWVDFRLLGSMIRPRYTEVLTGVDLTNMICTYRFENEDMGSPTEAEVTFLENNGARVHGFPGSAAWSGYEFYAILDFVRN